MPERLVSDSFWTDPNVSPLSPEAKSLYLYSWTNSHNNAAGIYEIGLSTIENETGWPVDTIQKCFDELKPKVIWYPEFNILWVRPFLKRQSKSPTYLIAVVRAIRHLPEKIITDFLNYNLQRYKIRLPVEKLDTLSIPYRYPIDTLQPVLSSTTGGKEGDNKSSSLTGESEGVTDEKAKEMAVISKAYEDNIGMITQAVADELKDIVDSFPAGWFVEAMKEAVANNARKLKYIRAILERWSAEGFKSDRRKQGGPARKGRSTRPGRTPTDEELDEQEDKYLRGQ